MPNYCTDITHFTLRITGNIRVEASDHYYLVIIVVIIDTVIHM